MMNIKAILFDKDGTLLDFEKTWGPSVAQVIDRLAAGDESRAEEIAGTILFDRQALTFGAGSTFMVDGPQVFAGRWAEILGRTPGEVFWREIDAMFVAPSREYATAFPGTLDTLRELKRCGLTLGIGTNDSEDGARAQAEKLGFTEHMAFIAGYDSGHGAKPAPGMVLAFAEAIGTAPSEIAMVGDSVHDLTTGRAAGALAIGVLTGLAGHDDLALHADHILENIIRLPEFLGLERFRP